MPRDDAGQAALWSVWAGAVLLTVASAVRVWSAAVTARQRAEAAADLAALAGASAQVRGMEVCGAAERVARAQAARLVRCVPDQAAVSVLVEVPVPLLMRRLDLPAARAEARAGPQR